METFGDKTRAFVYALIVHVLCIGSLFIGLLIVQSPTQEVKLAGPVIDVDLVGITKAPTPTSKPVRQSQKPAPPKPQPEAVKPPEPQPQSPTQVEQQDRVDREKIAEIAQEKADAERAQEEKHRQEQVQIEQEKKIERDRQKQLEQVRKELAQAEKKRKLEEDKLQQLKDVQNQKPVKAITQPVPQGDKAVSGAEGKDDSLQAQYFAAIQNAITNNWLRPDAAQAGLHCVIRIVQIPGGDVIGVQIGSPCNADPMTRTSIEQAVKRASPLPYKGFEGVFSRDFNLNFTYDG
jgi:colicin import membrane protein